MSMLEKVESEQRVTALILTGAGKFFSFGMDTDYITTQGPDYLGELRQLVTVLMDRISLFPVPTVAILNGHAFGAGAFLALPCDFRVMQSGRGWLSWPETLIGMRFANQRLLQIRSKLPPGNVFRDAILFSKKFSAEEAEKVGLVDVATEKENMMTEALKLISKVTGNTGFTRKALYQMKRDIYAPEVERDLPKVKL